MASEQGDRWVSDEQLWADANEDPETYVRLLRERGLVSPPHEQSLVLSNPNAPAQLPRSTP